jgi:ActR/RegA family two-component response regulator
LKIIFLNISSQVQGRLVKLIKEFIPTVKPFFLSTNENHINEVINNIEADIIIQVLQYFSNEELNLVKSIREISPNSRLLIIANYSNIKYKQKCFELGVELYYDKPSDIKKLIDEIVKYEKEINPYCEFESHVPEFLGRL